MVRKRHPILSFFLWAFALCLVLGSILHTPLLIIPTFAIIAGGLWLKAKGRK